MKANHEFHEMQETKFRSCPLCMESVPPELDEQKWRTRFPVETAEAESESAPLKNTRGTPRYFNDELTREYGIYSSRTSKGWAQIHISLQSDSGRKSVYLMALPIEMRSFVRWLMVTLYPRRIFSDVSTIPDNYKKYVKFVPAILNRCGARLSEFKFEPPSQERLAEVLRQLSK